LIRGCFGCDVIDFDGLTFLEIVDVVNAAAGLFLDRPTRLVFLLLALFATESPRWSRRTEIRGPIARRTRGAARARTESAATAKAATTKAAAKATAGWSRPGRPARSWSAKTSGTTEWSRRPILTRARFADGQIPSLKRLRVEFSNDFFGDCTVRELDEGKPPRPACFAIDRHYDVRRFCDGREVSPEIRFRRTVRQVADEQPDSQGFPRKA
jgi:hypothetical protein